MAAPNGAANGSIAPNDGWGEDAVLGGAPALSAAAGWPSSLPHRHRCHRCCASFGMHVVKLRGDTATASAKIDTVIREAVGRMVGDGEAWRRCSSSERGVVRPPW